MSGVTSRAPTLTQVLLGARAGVYKVGGRSFRPRTFEGERALERIVDEFEHRGDVNVSAVVAEIGALLNAGAIVEPPPLHRILVRAGRRLKRGDQSTITFVERPGGKTLVVPIWLQSLLGQGASARLN